MPKLKTINKLPLQKPSLIKRLLFSTLILIISFLLLFLIEIVLRVMDYGENFKLFVEFPGEENTEHMIINPKIGEKARRKKKFLIMPNPWA